MVSEERKKILLPKDFSEWSVEKQQGFFKGYRYGIRKRGKDSAGERTRLEETYPYNFLCMVFENHMDDKYLAFDITPMSFESFCDEWLEDQEDVFLYLRYHQGISNEECGMVLHMSASRVKQTEAVIIRKVLKRYQGNGKSEINSGKDSLHDIPLKNLGLSEHAMSCLRRGKIETLNTLIHTTSKDLLKIRSCGRVTVNEIEKKLEACGLSLKDSE